MDKGYNFDMDKVIEFSNYSQQMEAKICGDRQKINFIQNHFF